MSHMFYEYGLQSFKFTCVWNLHFIFMLNKLYDAATRRLDEVDEVSLILAEHTLKNLYTLHGMFEIYKMKILLNRSDLKNSI